MASKRSRNSIYIIGTPSAGKTTLIEAIQSHLQRVSPDVSVAVVQEVARDVVAQEGVDREDIRAGKVNAMEMQRKILETQLDREDNIGGADLILLDRSGIDPIVFAKRYGQPDFYRILIESAAWTTLQGRMKEGLVILCEPVWAWLVDDNLRLLPKNPAEWTELHETFCAVLRDQEIQFTVLPSTVTILDKRIEFVMKCYQASLVRDDS